MNQSIPSWSLFLQWSSSSFSDIVIRTRGTLTVHSSPPNLLFICRSIFWATLFNFCCWEIVRTLMACWRQNPYLREKKTKKNVSSSNHDLVSSNSNHRQEHMTNSTNLGWNGTFDTAELLDGTIEIVSVTDHDAHYELHIRLCTDNSKLKWYGLNFILSFGQSRKLLLSLWKKSNHNVITKPAHVLKYRCSLSVQCLSKIKTTYYRAQTPKLSFVKYVVAFTHCLN